LTKKYKKDILKKERGLWDHFNEEVKNKEGTTLDFLF